MHPIFSIIKRNLSFIVIAFCLIITISLKAQTVSIYASPTGANTGMGGSLATSVSLTRAFSVTKLFPNDSCIVWLADGVYNQLILDSTSRRTLLAPVIYKAINPKKAIFKPLTSINTASFQAIPDSIKSRIVDSTAKTKVKQLPLATYNLKNMSVWPSTFSIGNITSPKFYNKGMVLPMSRYPKDSNMTMKTVLSNGTGGKTPGGSFVYRDTTRFKYWLKEMNDAGLYLSGAWRVPWQIDVVKTKFIDTLADTLQQTIGVSGGIGDKYSRPKGNGKEPYWALNLVEEIGKPGEWSINFRTKMLYMWVPESAEIEVASDPLQPAFSIVEVNNTSFQNIAIIGGAGDGFTLTNCNNILIAGCDIANCSGNAITITGGSNCTVLSNDIHSTGGAGVKIASSNFLADQKNVLLSNHRVINNHIYSIATEKQVYYPPVDISSAIGTYIAHNLMHDVPQICVYFGGNSNVIEYNEGYDVGNKYGGASAIYRTGNFADRGNKVRYNYIHESPFGGGISEDNWGTGDSIYYNIVANTILATNNNGGYADVFSNNIYSANVPAHSSVILKDTAAQYLRFYTNLQTIYDVSAAYRAAYPDVATMLDTVNKANKKFTSLQWNQFNCNVLINNSVAFGGIKDTEFFNTNGTQKSSATLATAPAFKNYGTVVNDNFKLNGRLMSTIIPYKIDSLKAVSAFGKTCGTDWHINRIGLYTDAYRTSIDTTITKGVSPTMSWQKSSSINDTVTLTITIANPNISNTISSFQFYIDGVASTPTSILQQSISYDTIIYTAIFNGINAGNHNASLTIYDAPYWQYSSAVTTFSISKTLPLQLISFEGKPNGNSTNISWQTSNDVNVKAYQLEESGDGSSFYSINKIASKRTTNMNFYQYTATDKPNGIFRLKIINDNNSYTYSKAIAIINDCYSNRKLNIYPNPTNKSNIFTVEYFASENNAKGKLLINNSIGKEVFAKDITINKGLNKFVLNASHLNEGIYSVTLYTASSNIETKLIVLSK